MSMIFDQITNGKRLQNSCPAPKCGALNEGSTTEEIEWYVLRVVLLGKLSEGYSKSFN
jgi:hypothetical protein